MTSRLPLSLSRSLVAASATVAPGTRALLFARPNRRETSAVAAMAVAQLVAIVAIVTAAPASAEGIAATAGHDAGFFEILLHNTSAWALWVLGATTLGLSTATQAVMSTVVFGFAIAPRWHDDAGLAATALLHAPFELTAFAIAFVLAMRPAGWLIRWLTTAATPTAARQGLLHAAATWAVIALTLLVIAAAIEAAVAPGWQLAL